METVQFDATIIGKEGMDAAYVEFPFDVESLYGTKGRVLVNATFDDIGYRGQLANMGGGCHIIGLTKAVRQALGKSPGDSVHVTIARDTQPRVVELPPEFSLALDGDAAIRAFFESLSPSSRKAYAGWITEARTGETKKRRIDKAMVLLGQGEKHPR